MKRRIIAVMLAAIMLLTCPVGVTQPGKKSKAFSRTETIDFEKNESVAPENAKTITYKIKRKGFCENKREVIVSAYDISTTYGDDYLVYYNDKKQEKITGSVSMFSAFKTNSTEVTRQAEAASVLGAAQSLSNENDYNKGFDALDDIGAKAVSFPVIFDKYETEKEIKIEILNDNISEYDESFLLGICAKDDEKEDKNLITGKATVCIKDDEKKSPVNSIGFKTKSCRIKSGEKTKRVYFERTGNLAVISKAVLYQDNKPFGYISFVPYQKKQCAMLPEGAYTLVSNGSSEVKADTIIVKAAKEDASKDSKNSKEKLDSLGIDEVPEYDEYMDGTRRYKKMSDSNSWFPDWAKNSSTDNNDYTTYMGSSSNELFKGGGKDDNGRYDFESSTNSVKLSTDGGDSWLCDSHIYADCKTDQDLTGYCRVESKLHVENLDRSAKVNFGIYQTASKQTDIGGNGEYDLSLDIPDKCHNSKYIYYENIDPSDWDDGCQFYFPNGYKLIKRKYLVQLSNSESVTFIDQAGKSFSKSFSPTGSALRQDITMGNNNNIQVNLDNDSYPVSIVGYKFDNNSGGISSQYSLGSDHNIKFDNAFLKANEDSYCFKTNVDNQDRFAFKIIPIVAKIGVNYSIDASTGGTITLENSDKNLYKGDYAVFSGKSQYEGWNFSGVDVYTKKSGENTWTRTTYHPGSDGKVSVRITGDYDDYRFQGIFDSYKNQITVNYADGAQSRGKAIIGGEGIAVSADRYVVNNYTVLQAKPNAGYMTKWTSNGRVYYGNTLYYQMDGKKENDSFIVDFVPTSQAVKGTVKGKLCINRVNLKNSDENYDEPLANRKVTIFSDKVYTATTDDEGYFEIKDFLGVEAGKYTANVETGKDFAYFEFLFENNVEKKIVIPEFTNMPFYPYTVMAALNGANSEDPDITLDKNSTVDFHINVKKVDMNSAIEKVTLHFYRTDENGDVYDDAFTTDATADTETSSDASLVAYNASVTTDKLPAGSRVYVEVSGTKDEYITDKDGNETKETVSFSSGVVDAGYNLKDQLKDYELPLYEDIPYQPGLQQGKSVDWSLLQLDFLGCLDLSLSGKGGGYFISQQADADTYYLVAGFNMTSTWTPRLDESYKGARQTRNDLLAAEQNSPSLGSTGDTGFNTTSDTTGKTKSSPVRSGTVKPVIKIAPTFMLKFTVKTYIGEDGNEHMYIGALDFAIGADELIKINVPFSVYGVPFYVNITFNGEQYAQWQATFENTADTQLENPKIEDAMTYNTNQKVYIEASNMDITLKGGIGYNNFVGAYLSGGINPTVLAQSDQETGLDAGGNIKWKLGAGADMAIFNLSLNFDFDTPFGNDELRERIHTLSQQNALKSSKAEKKSDDFSLATTDGTEKDMASMMNNRGFRVLRNTDKSYKTASESGARDKNVLIEKSFRGADVKLIRLENGKILAMGIQDNGADRSSFNYLSAVTAVSDDNGKTWSKPSEVSKSNVLQFNVNAHQLNNKILITWSEGDMDAVMAGKNAVNSELSAQEVAKALNTFCLKGRFFNPDGTPEGEAFNLVEDAGVSASPLQADEKNGLVWLYYQRCKYDDNKDVQATDLLNQETTFSYLTIDPSNENKVTLASDQLLARSEDGKKAYKITEIKPFVFKGIMGDIVVIDKDGKYITKDSEGNQKYSIDDRRVFLRINNDKDGKLTQGTMIPLSDANAGAQNIHLESTDDHIYLFYNQDGKINAYSDFVMPKDEYDRLKKEKGIMPEIPAIVDTDTGKVTVSDEKDAFVAKQITFEDESVNSVSDIATSINDNGDILLSWVADSRYDSSATKDTKPVYRNELYGIMLKADQNGRLSAKGNPVALTNNNKTINKADCIAISNEDFLLAYTMLDGDSVYDSSGTSVVTQNASFRSDLEIESVKLPDHPMPGTDVEADVTVKNNGLKPAKDVNITASGLGIKSVLDTPDADAGEDDYIYPGKSKTIKLLVTIPDSLNADRSVTFKAADAESQSEKEAIVKCGSYIVPVGYPKLESIPNSKSYRIRLRFKNIGNKAGKAELNYTEEILGDPSEDAMKTGTLGNSAELSPGSESVYSGTIPDTLVNGKNLVSLRVRMGSGYDQTTENILPDPKATRPKTDSLPIGLAKNKTFTSGNFKYKVTKKATKSKNGEVLIVGLSKKGKKASKLEAKTTVKLAAKSGKYKAAKYTIKTLGKNAYKKAKASKVILNKYITKIPDGSMSYCKKLKALVLKKKLKKSAKNAFKGCKKKIKVSGASKKVNKANVKLLKKGTYKKFYC